jgi:hypothetical protein
MDSYCRNFVESIFLKHDDNRNNVLERSELKAWVRDELKGHKYFNKKMIQKNFENFFQKVDTNKDNKIDRWELYDYCINNITPDDQ